MFAPPTSFDFTFAKLTVYLDLNIIDIYFFLYALILFPHSLPCIFYSSLSLSQELSPYTIRPSFSAFFFSKHLALHKFLPTKFSKSLLTQQSLHDLTSGVSPSILNILSDLPFKPLERIPTA